MRIVTWNCGMVLARKAPNLLALNPDIAVVQESSKKSVDVLHGHGLSGLWFGANPNKGLAVLCRRFALQAVGKRQVGGSRSGSWCGSGFQLAGGLGLPDRDSRRRLATRRRNRAPSNL